MGSDWIAKNSATVKVRSTIVCRMMQEENLYKDLKGRITNYLYISYLK